MARNENMATLHRMALLGVALVTLVPFQAPALERPLWEAGMGVAYINFPYYRGAEERKQYFLPAPYVVYRGEYLKVTEKQVRGLLYKSDRAELNISVNAAVPVKSDEVAARRGMPDLDATFEIGPALDLHLIRSEGGKADLDLRLPLRPVWNIKLHYTGWLFQPQLNLDMKNIGGYTGWNLGLVTGPIFSDQRYSRYYYSVEPAYATPTRSTYSASGGYSGAQFTAALSKRFPNYWVGGFTRLDSLKGAAFSDSPLVTKRQNFMAGIAISWIFDQSKTMVNADVE